MFDWFLNMPLTVGQKRCTMFAVELIVKIGAQAMTVMRI